MALIIRKTKTGTRIEGELPKKHTFAARGIARDMKDGLYEVYIVVNAGEPTTYKLTGFEERDEDGSLNLSAWEAEATPISIKEKK